MSFELTKNELSIARKVAQGSRSRYRDFVETDDVHQELVAWMLGHQDKVEEWREGYGYKALYRSLKHEARRYCEAEKAAKVGYEPVDNEAYTVGMLRILLPMALSDEWETSSTEEFRAARAERKLPDVEIRVGATLYNLSEMARAHASRPERPRTSIGGMGAGSPASNLLNMLIDVRRAMDLVPENAADVLLAAVEFPKDGGFDYDALAEHYEVAYRTVQKRVERSLQKLADVLNEPPEQEPSNPYAGIPRYVDANVLRAQFEEVG